MFTFAYPAVFHRDEDGRFLVSFSDFPAAHTDGAEANEAVEEAIDCWGAISRSVWPIRRRCPSPRA